MSISISQTDNVGLTVESDPLALKIASNLSDINNAATARTNLAIDSNFVSLAGTQTVSGQKTFTAAALGLGTSINASSYDLGAGATISGVTKAIRVGTSGLAGSTTNITVGSTTGTSTTTLQGITNGVTQAVGDNSTKLATTAFVVGNGGLSTNVWAPAVISLSSLSAGTGSNVGSSYTVMDGRLLAPSAATAGYATRGFTLRYPANSLASAYNFSTASGHAVKVYSAQWASTTAGVKMRGVFGRMGGSMPVPATLSSYSYGWEWDWSTRTMNIIAHDGTTLTTTAVTWNPAVNRTYEITATSNGSGTISLYVDGTLLGTSSGGPVANISSSIVWWQLEIENQATAGAQVDCFFQNPKVITNNG